MGKKKRNKSLQTKEQGQVTWFLDENLTASSEGWLSNKKVETATTLKLTGKKDQEINSDLSARFNNVVIVTANRKVDKSGDYFNKPDNKTGYVLFDSSLARAKKEIKIEYLKKFETVFKNESKLLGATVTLSQTSLTYKKGNKSKTLKYTQFL